MAKWLDFRFWNRGFWFEFLHFYIDIIILKNFLKQVKDIGKVKCIYCTKCGNYESRGMIALTDHVKKQGQVIQMITTKTNYVIPGYSYANDQSYGIHPLYQSLLRPKELKTNSSLLSSFHVIELQIWNQW